MTSDLKFYAMSYLFCVFVCLRYELKTECGQICAFFVTAGVGLKFILVITVSERI